MKTVATAVAAAGSCAAAVPPRVVPVTSADVAPSASRGRRVERIGVLSGSAETGPGAPPVRSAELAVQHGSAAAQEGGDDTTGQLATRVRGVAREGGRLRGIHHAAYGRVVEDDVGWRPLDQRLAVLGDATDPRRGVGHPL